MNQKYRVEISGEVIEPHSRGQVSTRLAELFKCQPARMQELFDGKTHTLKTGLDWDTARKYRRAIEGRGAKCYLRVVMDRETFRAACFTADSTEARKILATAPSESEAAPVLRRSMSPAKKKFQFDTARLFPALFHPPALAPVFSEEEAPVGVITSLKATVSYLAALFLSIAIAFFVQWHLGHLWAKNLGTGPTGTIMSILLFFAIILFLPNLIRPPRKLAVELTHHGEKIAWQVRHERTFSIAHRKLAMETDTGEGIARMFKAAGKSHYICQDKDGAMLLSAEEEPDIDDLYLDTVKDIRDELMGWAIVEYAKMARDLLSRLASAVLSLKISGWKAFLSRNTPAGTKAVGKIFVIRDSAGVAKGHVIVGRLCRIVLYSEKITAEELRQLFGFGLLMADT